MGICTRDEDEDVPYRTSSSAARPSGSATRTRPRCRRRCRRGPCAPMCPRRAETNCSGRRWRPIESNKVVVNDQCRHQMQGHGTKREPETCAHMPAHSLTVLSLLGSTHVSVSSSWPPLERIECGPGGPGPILPCCGFHTTRQS